MKQQIFSQMESVDKIDFIESQRKLCTRISACLSAMIGSQLVTLFGNSPSKKQDVVALICCWFIIGATLGPGIYKKAKAHIQLTRTLKNKYSR